MERNIIEIVRGTPAIDGAGVRLTRVLGGGTTESFDPFLMLDAFDSRQPRDYIAGFPFHPHRGIETLTYLVSGEMTHRDSMGNTDTIHAGEAQWMTAGSGILHEEMPQPSERMLGFQLWLNLPKASKMAEPSYHPLAAKAIAETAVPGAKVRVLAGSFNGVSGYQPLYVKATVLDITLEAGETFRLALPARDTAFVFTLEGELTAGGRLCPVKTAARFGEGEALSFTAGAKPSRVMLFTAPRLDEPIAWGGPIVMNTREELEAAFSELRNGTFIKSGT